MISREEVEHVAQLARLRFDEAQVERLQGELSRIIEYINQLRAIDLTGVPATAHAVSVSNVFRPDEEQPCLTQQEALANAPAVERGHFLVPRIG